MLNAATSTMIDSTKNIATRSTCQRLEQRGVDRLPVGHHRPALQLPRERGEDLADAVGDRSVLTSIMPIESPGQQQRLRVGDRHDHEGLVVVVDADLEDRA